MGLTDCLYGNHGTPILITSALSPPLPWHLAETGPERSVLSVSIAWLAHRKGPWEKMAPFPPHWLSFIICHLFSFCDRQHNSVWVLCSFAEKKSICHHSAESLCHLDFSPNKRCVMWSDEICLQGIKLIQSAQQRVNLSWFISWLWMQKHYLHYLVAVKLINTVHIQFISHTSLRAQFNQVYFSFKSCFKLLNEEWTRLNQSLPTLSSC